VRYLNIILSIASSVLLIPIYLNFLSVDQYGLFVTIASVTVIFSLIDPGISALFIQKISAVYAEADETYISSMAYLSAFTGITVAAIVILVSTVLGMYTLTYLFEAEISEVKSTFAFLAASAAILIFIHSLSAPFQAINKPAIGGSFLLINNFFRIPLIVFLFTNNPKIEIIAVSNFISAVIAMTFALLVFFRSFKWSKMSALTLRRESRKISGLFGWTAASRLSKTAAANFDKIIISKVFGTEVVAIYSILQTPISMVSQCLSHPISALRPIYSQLWGANKNNQYESLSLKGMQTISGIILLAMLPFAFFGGIVFELWLGDPDVYDGTLLALLFCLLFAKIWCEWLSCLSYSAGQIKATSAIQLLGIALAMCVFGILCWKTDDLILSLGYQAVTLFLLEGGGLMFVLRHYNVLGAIPLRKLMILGGLGVSTLFLIVFGVKCGITACMYVLLLGVMIFLIFLIFTYRGLVGFSTALKE
jgi:O-antigen/teichoic acid export membrane protein